MQRKERLQEPNVFFRAKGFSGESGTRGRRCQTLCRIRTYAPLIASISSSPLSFPSPTKSLWKTAEQQAQTGTQQQHQEQK